MVTSPVEVESVSGGGRAAKARPADAMAGMAASPKITKRRVSIKSSRSWMCRNSNALRRLLIHRAGALVWADRDEPGANFVGASLFRAQYPVLVHGLPALERPGLSIRGDGDRGQVSKRFMQFRFDHHRDEAGPIFAALEGIEQVALERREVGQHQTRGRSARTADQCRIDAAWIAERDEARCRRGNEVTTPQWPAEHGGQKVRVAQRAVDEKQVAHRGSASGCRSGFAMPSAAACRLAARGRAP